MDRGTPRAPFLVLLGLLLIVLFMFEEVVFRGRVFYERDICLVWYPYIEALHFSIASGSLPFWNPFVSFGQPLWANPAAQIFYPFTWLALLLTPSFAYGLFVLFHLVVSGFGLFLFGKRLGMSPQASFVSASVWMLSGPFLSMINLWHHFAGVSFFPWVLLATDQALRSPSLRHTLLLALTIASQILAGSADACAMALLLAAAYSFRFVRGWSSFNSLLSVGGGATLLAATLTAAQWLPALEIFSHSARVNLDSPVRQYWSVHPYTLVQLILPFRWAEISMPGAFQQLFFESFDPFVASLYLGLPALALALASLWRPNRLQLFFFFAALTATFVAFGKFGILYSLFVTLLPPLRILRYPVKAMVVTAFSVAVLAGMGFDSVLEPSKLRRRLIPTLGVLAAFGFGAVLLLTKPPTDFPFSFHSEDGTLHTRLALWTCSIAVFLLGALLAPYVPRLSTIAVAAVPLLDLVAAHKTLNQTAPSVFFKYKPPTVDVMKTDHFLRIHVREYITFGKSGPTPEEKSQFMMNLKGLPESETRVVRNLESLLRLTPVVAGRWDLETSYDEDPLGLYSDELKRLVARFREVEGTGGFLRLFELGSVSKVLSMQPIPGLVPIALVPNFYPEPLHVSRTIDPLPRCHVVSSARIAPTEQALLLLTDPGFDPRHEVILPSGAPLAPEPDFHGTCTIRTLIPDQMEAEVSMSHPGYVVTADTYDPGWRVKIDGRSAPLLRGNVAFRAVAVPEGSHHVEFLYRPLGLRLGLWVSLLSLLSTVWLARKAL